IINLSDREFSIDGFAIKSGDNYIFDSTQTQLNLTDNTLSAGEKVSIVHQLSSDTDNNISAAILLTDQLSGKQYIVAQSYELNIP
ncbi:MAG: hypothetical protein R3240_11470, partial [Gammaproteobacteria bacterium]|nr:hypothetical protein [Gammaproteobacteria bacterium]